VVRVSRESKGRGGKTVTVVRGLPLDDAALTVLAKELKTACGSGGTAKEGVLEIQGDHVDLLMTRLAGRGWTLKRSGG
jgi:translation initiation factor 1